MLEYNNIYIGKLSKACHGGLMQGVRNDFGSTKVWTIRELFALLLALTHGWFTEVWHTSSPTDFLSISTWADSWKSISSLLVHFIAVANIAPLWHLYWSLPAAQLEIKPKIRRGRFVHAVATQRALLKLVVLLLCAAEYQAKMNVGR